MKNIKVAVVDDHELFRDGIAEILNKQNGVKVIMKAANGKDALSNLKSIKKKPDIVLMDVQMPVLNGIETTKKILEKFWGIKVIALTMHDNDQVVSHLIESGASGFLAKDSPIDVLMEAITSVHEKGHYLDQRTSYVMMKNLAGKSRPVVTLNEKEITVVKLICSEYTAKEIADIMKLSHRTVEALKLKIQGKVGVKKRWAWFSMRSTIILLHRDYKHL